MFQHSTTIIVGAGASFDFKLPLGEKLWTNVKQSIAAIDANVREVRDQNYYPPETIMKIVARNSLRGEVLLGALSGNDANDYLARIMHLAIAVRDADVHASVDDFLIDNPSWTGPIRALIAFDLFNCLYTEQDRRWIRHQRLLAQTLDRIGPTQPGRPNWLRRFVGVSRDFLRGNPVSARLTIVNFNYDRVMETVLRHFWDRSEQKFAAFDDCFEFLYSYGAFESLPEEMASPTAWIIKQSTALGFAGSGESASAKEVQARIDASRTIFMVGFSCGSSNAELLGLDRQHAGKIFFQNYGNSDIQLQRTLEAFGVPSSRADESDVASLIANGFFNQIGTEMPTPKARRVGSAVGRSPNK